jgi:peptide/nickel transport system ATP-binding protein
MNPNLLEVSDLKTYFFTKRGEVRAVDGVSFSVHAGESLGLVGESGCGKTITCLSLLRLVPRPAGKIVSGKILFEEEDLLLKNESEMRKIRGKKIAIILQDPMSSLNPSYPIGEQVAEVVRLHQRLKGRALWDKVMHALKLVRIPSPEVRMRDYPHQMSGGMRQRVAGAIALSCSPKLLIADEPTTSLDVTIQKQYLSHLRQLQKESGMGMIFITHDFGIVAAVCDKVAVMYSGKIVESASARDLFNNPRHPYTRAIMACVPNIEVEVKKLASIEGQPPSLLNPPPGCRFAPRCGIAEKHCWVEHPIEVQIADDHKVSCWNV